MRWEWNHFLLEAAGFFSSAQPATSVSEAMDACPGLIAAGFGEEVTPPSHLHSLHREAVNVPFSVTVKISHGSPHSLNSRSSLPPFENWDGACILVVTLSP